MAASARPAAGALLHRLGDRVRSRRKDRALTLRELARAAAVSERFLGLLEAGSANVSVTRLDDIARALGTSAAELLADEAGAASAAGPAARGPLVALLGLRGAGKTAVGSRAAARLELPFIELDALVAGRAGMTLEAIFEMQGAAYYRRLEREELERLVDRGGSGILATGGSLVTDGPTFEMLRRAAVTVWLRARPEDHYRRVIEQGDARPMANRADAMQELKALLRARRALYERADHVIDTSALGLDRAVERLVRVAREAAPRAGAA